MTKALLLLPFLLFVVSCTLTKRVHRPGYHVVWHKQQRESDKQPKEKAEVLALKNAHDATDWQQNKQSVNFETALNTSEFTVNENDTSGMNDSDTRSSARTIRSEATDYSKTSPLKHMRSSTKLQNKKFKIRPIFWRIQPENLSFMGLFFMWAGGLLIIGSIFILLGAFSGNGDGGWLNFILQIFSSSGLFWLLIFLFAFILILFLLYLLIEFVLGGPIIALCIGLGLFGFGLFLYLLGESRSE